MKKVFFKLPEYYLMILAVLAGYSPPFYINPIFIAIVAILILQIIFKNRMFGMILGIFFFLVNLYFIGALLSEVSEFPVFNRSAMELLFVGLVIFVVNMVFSLTMIYKYYALEFSGLNSRVEFK